MASTQTMTPHPTPTRSARRVTPLFALLLIGLISCQPQSTPLSTRQHVRIADRTFTLELALDPQARFRGLSDRKEIAPDGGMLFVFPVPQKMGFVMRRCLVPIDILFLDGGGRIVSTHAMQLEPYDTPEDKLTVYNSGYPAQFAIEIRGGTLGTLGLRNGDKIDLPLGALKDRAR
ncbi:MAG: hypothetical protein GC164_01055 [Phycisphaera sp.]|nr:hypothetical protein [Phycisphaera sp.]